MDPIIERLHPEFVVDSQGRKKSVILPIAEFEELLEELEDLTAIDERRDEPDIPHEQVVAELKRDGLL